MQQVTNKVLEVAEALVARLGRRGFKISPKSVILTSPPQLAAQVAARLERRGLQIKAPPTAKDLGVDAHTHRRSTKVIKGRITKAGKRAQAIKGLVRADRAARTLARTGFKPQATWGLEAQGLAPSTLRTLRSQVAGMSGCKYPGGCATTTIRLAYGEEADPHIFGCLQLFKEWFALVKELEPQRAALNLAWTRLVRQLRDAPSRWGRIKGTVSAVIATLLDLEWDPVGPGHWTDLDGAEYDLVKCDPDELIDYAIAGAVNQQVWNAVSKWHHGGGAQGRHRRESLFCTLRLSSASQEVPWLPS